MRLSKVSKLILALTVVLFSLPGLAQPRIDTVIHSARKPLNPGDVLHVIMTGVSGGKAEVEILGLSGTEGMLETSRGRYEADITIPPGMDVKDGTLMVTLVSGGRQFIMQSAQPITILPGSSGPTVPPVNTSGGVNVVPADGSTTTDARPRLKMEFPANVLNSIVLMVDGKDVSSECLTDSSNLGANELAWTPRSDLSFGRHTAQIAAIDVNGRRQNRTWSFNVPKAAPPPTTGGRVMRAVAVLPQDNAVLNGELKKIEAEFPVAVNFRTVVFRVNGQDVSRQANVSGRLDRVVEWTPSTPLLGSVNVEILAQGVSGESLEDKWSFTVRRGNSTSAPAPTPPPSSPQHRLGVSNVQGGQLLGSRFVISGTGVPGTAVTARVEHPKMDFLSQLAGTMLSFQGQGKVDNQGRYSINLDASNVRQGQPMNITVTDNISSPAITMSCQKGQPNQAQAPPPSANTNNSNVNVTLSPMPTEGQVVTSGSPRIGATFNTSVDRAQLLVDGQDFTNKANFSGTQISWQPGYSLDQGKHQVLVVCWVGGKRTEKNWNFQVAQEQRHVNNQANFAVVIPSGWVEDTTAKSDPSIALHLTRGQGISFTVAVAPPQSLQSAFAQAKQGVQNQGGTTTNDQDDKINGVPAKMCEVKFGSGEEGAIVLLVNQKRTYMLVVGLDSSINPPQTLNDELMKLLTSFELL